MTSPASWCSAMQLAMCAWWCCTPTNCKSVCRFAHREREWLETIWLGCTVERWLENKTWNDVLAWCDENESQHNSDCGLFIRFAQKAGLGEFGAGYGNYLATGTYFYPASTRT